MKAITYYEYGSIDNLKLEEVEIPTPEPKEVRIKIHAASINSWDWDLVQGTPFYVRLVGGGLKKPKKKIIGCDVAGIVESIGDEVSGLEVGDEVFGDISEYGWGGFAEYVCANESSFTHKPHFLTFEEAAAMPQAGVMALQGVRDYHRIRPDDKVLINGGGGGVGSFSIQLANLYGAEITAVDRTSKLDAMKALGADHVVDFTQEDVTKRAGSYHLILDTVGHHSIFEYKRILLPGGTYRLIGGSASVILQSMCIGPFVSAFGNKQMGILAHQPNKALDQLATLCENENIKPVIDRVLPLSETKEAFRHFGEGNFKGKVVIKCT